MTPQNSASSNPAEKIYEEWDCPKVEATAPYAAMDSDELDLKPGDTANVLRKLSDSGKKWDSQLASLREFNLT